MPVQHNHPGPLRSLHFTAQCFGPGWAWVANVRGPAHLFAVTPAYMCGLLLLFVYVCVCAVTLPICVLCLQHNLRGTARGG